jgi:hypothetical protein
VECFDSSEVFSVLYRGMLLYHDVFCPLLSKVLGFCGHAPEPRAHEVDQSLGRLLSFDPHAPSSGKKEGWGTSYYPRRASFDGLR